MNDQANKILIALLQKASDGIDSAVSFSQAQIPDVVHQLLIWNTVSSILFQLFILSSIGGYIFAVYKFHKASNDSDISEGVLIAAVVAFFVGGVIVIGLGVAFFAYFDWLKIWLAPKLYLIEYAASLIK
ncbi:TPA: hypothetical protein MYP81_000679 [Citrobacter farmeri]|nr:hypothetical protein [Citrobacter farmeri]HCB1663631.1 hypothetical protein [Citrobacter farmeri]HCB1670820.1 hypothetical protein [Citrobacter farmeri]HCB1775435.1 hypothetical protein [Citrobacter farmeri]HCB1778970.1 hypothetical protein [Citrobacter farmeri]